MSATQKFLAETQFNSYSKEIITNFVVINVFFNLSHLYQSFILCNKKL